MFSDSTTLGSRSNISIPLIDHFFPSTRNNEHIIKQDTDSPQSLPSSDIPTGECILDALRLEIIDLSSYSLSQAEKEVLQLGISFCPSSTLNTFDIINDLYLFARKLTYTNRLIPPIRRSWGILRLLNSEC